MSGGVWIVVAFIALTLFLLIASVVLTVIGIAIWKESH